MQWLVDNWIPLGHRCMDCAPEGSYKTFWGCAMAVSVAAGKPFLGSSVKQGPVLIIDGETPWASLTENLQYLKRLKQS